MKHLLSLELLCFAGGAGVLLADEITLTIEVR